MARRNVTAEALAWLERQTGHPGGIPSRDNAPRLRLASDAPAGPTPAELSGEQTELATEKLFLPGGSIRFPYPSVHSMARRIAAGRLVFVAANTGQGKTTFLLDVLDRWAEAGVRVDYLGTEQEPDELRTKWACLRADVPPGVAVNREWDDFPEGELWRERVAEELAKLDDAYGEQIVFSPEKFITLPKIEQAALEAQRRGADVLVIDHVDRIDVGRTENGYAETLRLIRRLKELARDCELVVLAASQMNREARKGDALAVYRPPQLHHMQGGGMKEQEADLVLGLWRPIRKVAQGETAEDFRALLAAVKSGDEKPDAVLMPNTMAVGVLKHRTWGSHEGMRCQLRVSHGRISDPRTGERCGRCGVTLAPRDSHPTLCTPCAGVPERKASR